MFLEITEAEYVDGYRLRVVFNDGIVKEMDFTDVVRKYPVFKPLQNVDSFRKFNVTDTLEWEDGAIDIAPEYVYEHGV
ncbi:MAG: DUF2442 domain-containing protein [Bacteroidia bacterium]|nr:DUF2442 domain-containing protein [Bacteroidales bacterium]MDO5341415.1 DUF2442 domain-containing protein [Bacteroidia bacterium]